MAKPAISILAIYPLKMIKHITKTCVKMFVVAVFIIASN